MGKFGHMLDTIYIDPVTKSFPEADLPDSIKVLAGGMAESVKLYCKETNAQSASVLFVVEEVERNATD